MKEILLLSDKCSVDAHVCRKKTERRLYSLYHGEQFSKFSYYLLRPNQKFGWKMEALLCFVIELLYVQ